MEMNTKRIFAILMMAVMAAAAGYAANLKTVVLSIEPPMECSNCENRVATCITDVEGVKSVTPDRKSQTVSISYDDKVTSVEAIRAALTKINCRAVPVEGETSSGEENTHGAERNHCF